MPLSASPSIFRSPLRPARRPRPLYLGSYPPRECGIATFTEDLKLATDARTLLPADVIAINDDGKRYAYPLSVIATIERNDLGSYLAAADVINAHSADVVNIQHEYGLFGGERGYMLIELLARVTKPVVLTLHTVLPKPDATLRYVTRELCNRSDNVTVLAQTGRELLVDDYGIDPRKVRVILHGAPDVPLRSSRHFKGRFGLAGKTIISTFGLLSPGKGIEYLLDALPEVFARHPDAVYLLLGETHPEIKRRDGEAYRESLMRRAVENGIAHRVYFKNHYMSDEEVVSYLLATDVYVSPSLDPHQVVSGTLTYAVACGRVAIATASAYARELLAGRGVVVPFRRADALSTAINAVLSNPRYRRAMETAAYRFGRQMIWSRVAREYETTFRDAARVRQLELTRPLRIPAPAPGLFTSSLRGATTPSLLKIAE